MSGLLEILKEDHLDGMVLVFFLFAAPFWAAGFVLLLGACRRMWRRTSRT